MRRNHLIAKRSLGRTEGQSFRAHRPFLAGLLATCFLLGAGDAHAERRNVLEGQPPIRHKVEMRKNRFEISLQMMLSTNQDFRHFIGGGLVLHYHITDWFGIAGQFAYGGGINTGLTGRLIGDGDINNAMNGGALPITETGLQPSRSQFNDHIATTDFLFSLYAALTPFAGKISLFGALVLRYDVYGMFGVGAMHLKNSYNANNPGDDDPTCSNGDPNRCGPANDGIKFSGMFGVGSHLYFNNWIGLVVELRDFLASTNPGGFDVNGDGRVTADDQTISNNLFVSFGVSIMLPPGAKISP